MSKHSSSGTVSDDAGVPRTERLDRVSIQLETVLESLDLETRPRLAEEIATATQAIERAREIEAETGTPATDRGGFVFRLR